MTEENMPRRKLSVTLDEERVRWLDKQIEKERFRNRSHGLDVALKILIEKEEKK